MNMTTSCSLRRGEVPARNLARCDEHVAPAPAQHAFSCSSGRRVASRRISSASSRRSHRASPAPGTRRGGGATPAGARRRRPAAPTGLAMRHGHFLLYADPGAEDEAVAQERACRVDTPRRASIYRGTTPQCAQLLELDGRPTASGTARSQQDDEDEDLHVLRPWGMDTASPSASPQTAGAAPRSRAVPRARSPRPPLPAASNAVSLGSSSGS
jgi:hypothetical protein